MAVVSSLHRCFSPSTSKKSHDLSTQFPKSCNFVLGLASSDLNRCKNRALLCCYSDSGEPEGGRKLVYLDGDEIGAKRRQILLQIGFAAFSFPPIGFVSNALAEIDLPKDFRPYTDDVNKFKIMIPQDWQVGSGEPNGFKSVTAFYPDDQTSSSNVSVAITGIGPDFTRMESFGKVDEFADTLVSGLDRSWQRPPGVKAKLVDCKSSKGFYYIEYTLQKPGESRKHLFTAIGMAFNGWYNRLYTVTGQFDDEEEERYGPKIQKAVASFKFI